MLIDHGVADEAAGVQKRIAHRPEAVRKKRSRILTALHVCIALPFYAVLALLGSQEENGE